MSAQRYFAAPVRWLRSDETLLAVSRVRPRWASVNETAAAIVQYCESDGGRSADEIHADFEARFGPVARGDLGDWLATLVRTGLLAGERDFAAQAPLGFDAYRVEHLYVELLARCNLRCVHCFMGGAPERTERLSANEVFALLEEFAASGGRYVTLSGGEPLIYPEFEEVARRVVQLGMYGTVITNGVRLRAPQLALLDELGFNVAISLDGITPEVNERIRGRSSLPTMATIERALAVLGPDRVVLSFTPVKANLGELEKLFSFVEERGIRRLNLSIYEEVGRASEFAGTLALDDADRLRLMRTVYHKAVELAGRVEIDLNDTRDILSQFSVDRTSAELHPLWRGVRVTSSGDVYPSTFGAVERFHLGNVREVPFRTVLASGVLRELYAALIDRDAKTPKCRECTWRQICRGGSVASAYCATGELYSPDPYCEAYLDVFPSIAAALAELAPAPVA
ncbi:MAG: radical SAM protein [Candidatus Eremiobacteraeota bacterium]|nr:radical SAM protein [Candidatus Eremiobacteraeota bacterium]